MKNNVVAIKHRQKDGNVDSVVTPEMRRQIRELKRELDQYDNRLAVHRDLFSIISSASTPRDRPLNVCSRKTLSRHGRR
jgi:hypothetical protein